MNSEINSTPNLTEIGENENLQMKIQILLIKVFANNF